MASTMAFSASPSWIFDSSSHQCRHGHGHPQLWVVGQRTKSGKGQMSWPCWPSFGRDIRKLRRSIWNGLLLLRDGRFVWFMSPLGASHDIGLQDPSLQAELVQDCIDDLFKYLEDEAVVKLWRAKGLSCVEHTHTCKWGNLEIY